MGLIGLVEQCPACGLIGNIGGHKYCRGSTEARHAPERWQWIEVISLTDHHDALAECDKLREALIPFAFIGRASMEPLGLAKEYDEARRLLGLEPASERRAP